MNNLVVIYTTQDGNLAVLTPASEYLETHTLDELIAKDVPTGVPYSIVNKTSIPQSNYFRSAWMLEDGALAINLDKAKLQYKQTADASAATLSQPLTQEYMRLVAIGGDTTAVQAQLKAINAAAEETAYLDATTVDELVACWPAELGPNPFLPVPVAE